MASQTEQVKEQIRTQVKQVQELRQLCRLMMEQQEGFLRQISDRLDALETDLTVTYAEEADRGGDFYEQ